MNYSSDVRPFGCSGRRTALHARHIYVYTVHNSRVSRNEEIFTQNGVFVLSVFMVWRDDDDGDGK